MECCLLTVESLVADDHTVWRPASGTEAGDLWQHVRLSFMSVVWELRCRRALSQHLFSACDVVVRCTEVLHASIIADWMRVTTDVRRVLGVSSSCFSGRDPAISVHEFASKWCVRDVLAHVSSGGATVHVHIPPFSQAGGQLV